MIRLSNKKGFTLIETLVTIGIFIILMGGISMLFKTIYSDSAQQKQSLSNIDQARIVEANFVNEVRGATYGVDGSFPLNQAGDSQLIFYTLYGTSGSNPLRIRYFASSTTLYKGIITPSGSPLSYNSNAEVIIPVQAGLSNGATPEFYYYDGNYAGTSTALVQPVNVNSVKFVKMNLVILKQDSRTGTQTFPVNAGAAIRNLKTNLGN